MNKIVNKCLLAGDNFMPEMHLRQPRFTYSTCGPLKKDKEKIENKKSERKNKKLKKQDIQDVFIKTK